MRVGFSDVDFCCSVICHCVFVWLLLLLFPACLVICVSWPCLCICVLWRLWCCYAFIAAAAVCALFLFVSMCWDCRFVVALNNVSVVL